MILVEKIRENLKQTSDVAKAVDAAVLACIDDGILKDFLLAHRAEVVDMVLTEYDEKSFVKGMKEEGFEEGRQSLLFSLVNEKILTLSDAASRAGLTEAEFTAKMENYLKKHKND